MNRERIAWIVSVLLLAVLALELPGSLGQRDDDYAWIRDLIEVHRRVVDNYVEPVNDEKLREKAIEGMLSDLDPFTNYVPAEHEEEFNRMLDNNFPGVGISLDMQDGKVTVVSPIDGSPADRAGVQAGDVITKVNGASIVGLTLPEVVNKVAGPLGTPVTLTVQRGSVPVDITMVRAQIFVPTVKGYRRNSDESWNYWVSEQPKVAYIRITQFDGRTFEDLQKVLKGDPAANKPGLMAQGLKGLILDLRFNPGGLLDEAVQVVNLFVKKGTIVTMRGRNRPEEKKEATGEGTLPDFPLIVLVNDSSASAAEIVSGSLKDNNRARIIGQRTYGKGSVQEVMPIDGGKGGELKLTVAYYYLPNGELVHRKKDATEWGVEPQIIVPEDEAGELAIHEGFERADTIHRPPSTRPATRPTTQPVDLQLQQAEDTIVGMLARGQSGLEQTAPATTRPGTMPATRL